MSDLDLTVEEFLHDLQGRLMAAKATMMNAYGVEPWAIWLQGSHRPDHQSLVAQGAMDEAALRDALRVATREFDLLLVSVQNLAGYLNRDLYTSTQKRRFKLSVLAREVLTLFESLAAQRKICLSMKVESEPEDFRGDPFLIRRALVNVIDNAVKYSFSTTGHGAQREIQCVVRRHSPSGHTLFRVRSYGVGVLPDELKQVFEYGRRGCLARDRDRRGTGIGLSEAKRILEAHGGQVILESAAMTESAYLTTVSLVFPPAV